MKISHRQKFCHRTSNSNPCYLYFYILFSSEESAVLVVDIFVNGVPLKKLVDHERSEISGLDPRKPFNNQPSASVLDPDSYCEVSFAKL